MSRACTPVLVGVTPPVSEIWVPFKNGQFSLWGMDYSPWLWKNSIDRNRLKKFMQLGINVKCMHTNFGGRGLSGFGDMGTLQKLPNFPFGAWYSPWSWKNSIDRNRLKKFMQLGIDVKCIHTNFGGRGLFGFGDMGTLQKRPNFPFGGL